MSLRCDSCRNKVGIYEPAYFFREGDTGPGADYCRKCWLIDVEGINPWWPDQLREHVHSLQASGVEGKHIELAIKLSLPLVLGRPLKYKDESERAAISYLLY